MKVLVLQHVDREGSARIGDVLRARRLDEQIVRGDLGERVPDDVDGFAALLVMGGPMGVPEVDRYPFLRDEMRLIERAVRAEVPVLGVCLGSQLVAAALGATVTKAPRPEIGWREVRLSEHAGDDPIWAGCPRSFTPLHWHGDVFTLPPGAVPLASSDATEHQAFRHGARTWGVLFHLEMRVADVEAMTSNFAADLAPAGLDRQDVVGPAAARLAEVLPIAERVFGAWAELARARR